MTIPDMPRESLPVGKWSGFPIHYGATESMAIELEGIAKHIREFGTAKVGPRYAWLRVRIDPDSPTGFIKLDLFP
jgi:hypothetical protein